MIHSCSKNKKAAKKLSINVQQRVMDRKNPDVFLKSVMIAQAP